MTNLAIELSQALDNYWNGDKSEASIKSITAIQKRIKTAIKPEAGEVERVAIALQNLTWSLPPGEKLLHVDYAKAAIAAMRHQKPVARNPELNAAIKRAILMLGVAGEHCEQHASEQSTMYDNAMCDGSCINDDCGAAANELEFQFIRATEQEDSHD